MSPAKKWFEISNASEKSADVFIYDSIGAYGVSAAGFVAEINAIKAPTINLHINSGGGSVFDGLAIYSGILAHPAHVRVFIDGIAASMAGVIAMAGDEIVMAENAFLMVHRVSSGCEGTAETMRAEAALLEKLEEQIVGIYAARTGKSPGSLFAAMLAETWLNSAECLAQGFCTSVTASKTPKNSVNLAKFKAAPVAVLASQPRIDAPDTVSNNMENLAPVLAPAPIIAAPIIAEPVAVVAAEPVAAITAETLRLAVKGATESAHAAATAAHEGAVNALRADFNARLAAKENENLALAKSLASAEQLSAANLGVLPILHAAQPVENAGDVLAKYRALEGVSKTAFFQANKDAIWKAYDAETCAR